MPPRRGAAAWKQQGSIRMPRASCSHGGVVREGVGGVYTPWVHTCLMHMLLAPPLRTCMRGHNGTPCPVPPHGG